MRINPLDVAALAAVAVFVVLGFRSGAVRQLVGLAGGVLAIALVALLAPNARDFLLELDPARRAAVVVGALLLALLVGHSAGSSLGAAVRVRMGRGVLGNADSVGGAVVGLAQGLLLVWLVGGLLATGSQRGFAAQAQRSTVVRTLAQVLPPPQTFARALARVLDDSGAPNPFVGLEPERRAPAAPPSAASARRIAAAATRSTVAVRGSGCRYGSLSVGSGFVVGRGYVVTNAHVIAGATGVKVAGTAGELSATPVLFDGDLDVAVLWVPDLQARPLRFAGSPPRPGSDVAALGYPGGGDLTVTPAEVSATYRAVGLDLYDEKTVTRRIVELRADVHPGNSGGPVVLQDGTVGGVVFAESKSDPDVGYALSPTEVSAEVLPAIGRTSRVPTGACIR